MAIEELATNAVYCMDALELLRALPDASVDAVITDPPYGQQLAKWDKPVDCAAFLGEALTPMAILGAALTIGGVVGVVYVTSIVGRTPN